MKRIDVPVQVRTRGSVPAHILWHDRRLVVRELLECWVHETGWWKPGGSTRRVYYRLRTDAGVVEVYRSGDTWTLSRIAD